MILKRSSIFMLALCGDRAKLVRYADYLWQTIVVVAVYSMQIINLSLKLSLVFKVVCYKR